MKISTKGRYGLIAMIDMVMHSNDKSISLKAIAKRNNISEIYLEQIFSVLKKEGLVISLRGNHGGYKLSKDARMISVFEVIKALEGDLKIINKDTNLSPLESHINKVVWENINETLENTLKGMDLQDIADLYIINNNDYVI